LVMFKMYCVYRITCILLGPSLASENCANLKRDIGKLTIP